MKSPLLIALGILIAFGGVSSCAAVSTYNRLLASEKGVVASWRDSQIWYDNFWKKVAETAQVTEKYKSDFQDVFLGSIEGRYPAGKPVQFIMESNPGLSPEVYTTLQRVIEAGRDDFSKTQQKLVDRQRAFDTDLNSFPTVMFASAFGFPSSLTGDERPGKDTDGDGRYTVLDYPIVTGARTKEAFASGEDEALKVFGE